MNIQNLKCLLETAESSSVTAMAHSPFWTIATEQLCLTASAAALVLKRSLIALRPDSV